MSTQPATISAPATQSHHFHPHWLWVAILVAVALVAVVFAVMALTGGGSDASPAGVDASLCSRLGSPC